MSILAFQEEMIACEKCGRLRQWSKTRAGTKAEYKNQEYWGRPVPSFGDDKGRFLIIGLAPGAHGANRTGRPFTGDEAGNYLYRALWKHGYSNQPVSRSRFDGLILNDAYIMNAVRCAPPGNTPSPDEFKNCYAFLYREWNMLPNLKAVLTLGEKAFKSAKTVLKERGASVKGVDFKHGHIVDLGPDFPVLIASYHTSRYNINTGVITEEMFNEVFKQIGFILKK